MAPITYRNREDQIAVRQTTPAWDPYKLLGIHDHKNRGFSCVGTAETQWNSRCRWQFFDYDSTPIAARLDAMAACDPSNISQKSLESLARLCLCPQNHQKEAPEKAREWYDKITVFLAENARTAALTADVDRLKLLLQDSLDENERLEQRMEGAVTAERTARTNEVERLFRQLKGVQADFEKLKVTKETEVDGLMKRLIASSANLEEARVTKVRRSRELDDLKDQLKQSDANTESAKQAAEKEINGLKIDLEWNTTLLNDAKRTASSQIDDLKKQLKESERCLKEQERTSSQDIVKLDEQLKDSNERLEALRTAGSQDTKDIDHLRQEVRRLSKQYDDSKIKSNARISHLQQHNETLNAQKHFNAFRSQVHLIIKHKRLEQAERANAELTEQSDRLMEQVGDMDQQLADQNVSFLCIRVWVSGHLLTSSASAYSPLSS